MGVVIKFDGDCQFPQVYSEESQKEILKRFVNPPKEKDKEPEIFVFCTGRNKNQQDMKRSVRLEFIHFGSVRGARMNRIVVEVGPINTRLFSTESPKGINKETFSRLWGGENKDHTFVYYLYHAYNFYCAPPFVKKRVYHLAEAIDDFPFKRDFFKELLLPS
jgi:hypothetical protein